MPESSNLTALSYTVDSIGKLFSDSKTRHTWTMDVDGETHIVVVTASWNSGKFVVELNGYVRFHQVVSGVFMYTFKFRDRFFKIQQIGDQMNLLIDSIPFSQYSARAKAAQAAVLKSYESRVKGKLSPSAVSGSPKSLSSPFNGDLAKRLGKKDEYRKQEDEEDFFSAPVKIQSFVTPNVPSPRSAQMTVIPNLIEFSEPPSAAKKPPQLDMQGSITPATGPVTPRDQISPSKLTNPFAAFDELAAQPVVSKPLVEEDNPFK